MSQQAVELRISTAAGQLPVDILLAQEALIQKPQQEEGTPASAAKIRWSRVRHAVKSMNMWKNIGKRTATAISNNGEVLDAGSLNSFMFGGKLRRECENAAAEVLAPTEIRTGPIVRPPGAPPSHVPVRSSLLLSPRRRVHRLGNELRAHLESPRQGAYLLARCTPSTEHSEGHFPHPLRWGSPLASPLPQETPPPGRLDEVMLPRVVAPAAPVSPHARPIARDLATPEDVKDARRRQSTHFTLSIAKGFKWRPKDSVHPMLAAVVKAEGEDRVGSGGSGGTADDRKADALVEDEGVHIARRLEKLRSKEMRRGNWTEQSDVTSDRHVLLQESPRPQALATARQLLMDVKRASGPSSLVLPAQPGDGTKTVADFKKFVCLVDADQGQELPPDAFVPLMFWFGFTQKRRSALVVLQCAFGHGPIPVAAIYQLAAHYKVQVQLAEGFQWLARKESFQHVSDFLSDQRHFRHWFSTMSQDIHGRVGIMDVGILLAQLQVPFNKKQLDRFLSHFIEAHNQEQTKLEPSSRTSEMKKRLNFTGFCALLSRCIVTWCINRTLDLVDPPRKVDPLENALRSSGHVSGSEQLEAAEDPRLAKRWAEVHRQILVSLLVNHRFWGRESRYVLASMSQPRILTFGQQLAPEGWLALFQRVRAQGMASTFPEDDEERDPNFLQKKAHSVVT